MVTSAYILQKDAHALALIKKVMIMILGGRRGIAVFITAYGAKGRRFETDRLLFFFIIVYMMRIKMCNLNAIYKMIIQTCIH